GLDGRLRLRVDSGRILEGGTLTTLLSAINLSQLPALLFGSREDLSGPGIMYERLQMEAIMQNQDIRVRNVAMRSTAFDLVGHGSMDIDKATIDLYMIAKPLQNLDALLAKIPLLRDLLGGRSHSLVRKVYHMHGPFTDAKVEKVKPEAAGLASAGIIEHLLGLPNAWFGSNEPEPDKQLNQ
ncbi:MAG: AsmA-like C-terminal domain-containing protein, partial [Mariprofundus sp.]